MGQACTLQVQATQIGIGQIDPAQACLFDLGVPQVRARQVCAKQYGLAQSGAAQIGTGKVCTHQAHTRQIGACQIAACAMACVDKLLQVRRLRALRINPGRAQHCRGRQEKYRWC